MRWLAFFLSISMSAALAAAEIKGLRSWQEAAHTRVVFDLSGAVPYRVFTMQNPERLVIDFDGARVGPYLSLPGTLAAQVHGIRHAARPHGGSRIVLDLVQPVAVASRLLPPDPSYGYRVVLDLRTRAARPAADPIAAIAAQAATPAPARSDPIALLAARQRPPAVGTANPPAARTAAVVPSTPAPRAATTPPPLVRPAPRDVIVAIDAGHGGADVGAIGPSGTYEKDITLAVARELAAIIERQPGMRAVLTRDGDRYLHLRERMERARALKADLFVSVHADAFRDRRVRGSSVYVLSPRGASSEAAKWLADKENAADLVGGVSLDDKDAMLKSVLLDLSQTASMEASLVFARHVLEALKDIGPVHRKQVQHAGFMVLKSPDIPSILVETAFISNPDEEKRLRSREYRRKLARAIHAGIVSYFGEQPPSGTRMAMAREHRVARGDTLSAIANRYAVSVNSLKLANNLDSEMVRAGAVLRIP